MAECIIREIKPEFSHTDDRGELIQLVSEGFNQVNVLKSNKGAVRGEHYHKINEEAFYVLSGSVIVEAELDGKTEKKQFEEGDFFVIPRLVMHSFYYPEDNICVQMYDKGVVLPEGGKDIYNE